MKHNNPSRAVLLASVVFAGVGSQWLFAPGAAAQTRSLPMFEVDKAWPKLPAGKKVGDASSFFVARASALRLAFFRSRRRQLRLQFTGLNLREHGQVFDVLEIIRDPVNDLMTEAAKLFRGHVTCWWCNFA